MKIDFKRILSTVLAGYDKIVAVAALAGLLASIFVLGARAVMAAKKQSDFENQLRTLAALHPTVSGIEHERLERAHQQLSRPDDIKSAVWNERYLTIPESRVSCVNFECLKPIEYTAKQCKFCKADQPTVGVTSDIRDVDNDGMPDVWEEQYKFNKNVADDALIDSDGDGFTNVEEYRAKKYGASTDPTNPRSTPPPWTKLFVEDTASEEFNLVFMSAMNASGGGHTFQINHIEGDTYWRKMGDTVLDFKITDHTPKTKPHETIPGMKVDISELVLEQGSRRVVLVLNERQAGWRKSGKLRYKLDNSVIAVSDGQDFELKDKKYRVKKIDADKRIVIIVDSSLGDREISIGPSGVID